MRKINNSLAAWYRHNPPPPWSAVRINPDLYTIYNGESFAGWVRREAQGWQADSVNTPTPNLHAYKQTARYAAQAVLAMMSPTWCSSEGIFYNRRPKPRPRGKVSSKPADGRGTPVLVRLPDADVRIIDAWIKRQPDSHVLTRPEAMRRLVRAFLLAELNEVPT